MATPFFDLIQQLRKLEGAPKVTYPFDDVAFPQTERIIKATRGTHILAFLSAEPDSDLYPALVLTEQVETSSDAQYVEVYHKYEVIPGKAVHSTRIDTDGAVVDVSRRRMLVADIVTAESVSMGVWNRTTMENSNSLLADQVITSRPLPGPDNAGTRKTEWGRAGTLKKKVVLSAVAAPVGPGVLDSAVEPGDGLEGEESETSIPVPSLYAYAEPIDPDTRIKTRVRKRLVANGTAGGITAPATVNITAASIANPTQLTIDAAILNLESIWPIKTGDLITIAGDSNTTPSINGNWPVTIVDSTHVNISVDVTAVAGSGFGTVRLAPEMFTEILAGDTDNAIEIGSQIDTSTLIGATKIWTEWMAYSYPEELVALDVFNNTGTSGAGASPTWPIPTNVSFRTGFNYSGEVAIRRKRYTGKSQVSITRSYSYGPPVADAVLQIRTSSGEIISEGGAFEDSRTFSIQTAGDGVLTANSESTSQKATQIENILTGSFTSTVLSAGSSGKAKVTLKLNASSPTTFTPSATFTASADVTPGRLGLFIKEVVTVTVPDDY